MTSTLNWEMRSHLHSFREGGKGQEFRWPVLTVLILHSNQRNRCWPGQDLIAKEIGTNQARVSAAIRWLFEHGAIYNVPYEYRVEDERELPPSKYVYQLTGLMRFDDEVVPYLYQTDEAVKAMMQELSHIGAGNVVAFLNEEVESVGYSPSAYTPNACHPDAPSAYSDGACKGSKALKGTTDKKVQITGSAAPASLVGSVAGNPVESGVVADNRDKDLDQGKSKPSIPEDYTELERFLCGLLRQNVLARKARDILGDASKSEEVEDAPSPNSLYDDEGIGNAFKNWITEKSFPWWRDNAKGSGSKGLAGTIANNYDWFQDGLSEQVGENEYTPEEREYLGFVGNPNDNLPDDLPDTMPPGYSEGEAQ